MKLSKIIELLNEELKNGDIEVAYVELPKVKDGEVIDLRYC